MSDCERSLNRSSSIAESESFLVALWNIRGHSRRLGRIRVSTDTMVHPYSSREQHGCPMIMLWRYHSSTVVAP